MFELHIVDGKKFYRIIEKLTWNTNPIAAGAWQCKHMTMGPIEISLIIYRSVPRYHSVIYVTLVGWGIMLSDAWATAVQVNPGVTEILLCDVAISYTIHLMAKAYRHELLWHALRLISIKCKRILCRESQCLFICRVPTHIIAIVSPIFSDLTFHDESKST